MPHGTWRSVASNRKEQEDGLLAESAVGCQERTAAAVAAAAALSESESGTSLSLQDKKTPDQARHGKSERRSTGLMAHNPAH